ncbi:hypothetical protein AAE478_004528 [Parahypoxylon ruwenzoriense]
MESLRFQLGETQGALTEKTRQWRQLRADYAAAQAAWTQEKRDLEAKLLRLEVENVELRGSSTAAFKDRADPSLATDGEEQKDGNDTVTITRSRMQDIESRFQKTTNELTEKTKLCETLRQQLLDQRSGLGAWAFPDITDDHVVARWKLLRDRIRELWKERFDKRSRKPVQEKSRQEFEQLSTHWKSYLTNGTLTTYLFRALVWRYLYTCLFCKYCRAWGKELGDTATRLARVFAPKASEAECQEWRMHTAALLHKACETDAGVLGDVTQNILDAVARFTGASGAADLDRETALGLEKKLSEMVAMAVELSAIFARSRYVALMSDKPGSTLTRGFPLQEATMDVRNKYGSHGFVDMMVSPCLLKKDDDYSVLVKADVIC